MTAYAWRRNDPDIAAIWEDVTTVRREQIEVVLERKILGALSGFGETHLRDPISGDLVLDDDFEPIPLDDVINSKHLGELAMRFYAAVTGARHAPQTAIQVNVDNRPDPYPAELQFVNADGTPFTPCGGGSSQISTKITERSMVVDAEA
ncbi:MAG: hypothetical protein JKX88_10120 [Marinicaulis sp.]|nr:hypothetical protein [Marinicaulis sp.]